MENLGNKLFSMVHWKAEKRIIAYTIFGFWVSFIVIKALWGGLSSATTENSQMYKELYKECRTENKEIYQDRRKFEKENMRLMIEVTRLMRYEKDTLKKLTEINNRIVK